MYKTQQHVGYCHSNQFKAGDSTLSFTIHANLNKFINAQSNNLNIFLMNLAHCIYEGLNGVPPKSVIKPKNWQSVKFRQKKQ